MKRSIMESHRLSDGRLLELTRFGNSYGVMVTAHEGAPTLHQNLKKAEAFEVYEGYLRADVMEEMV